MQNQRPRRQTYAAMAVIAFVALVAIAQTKQPCSAQMGGGIGLGQQDLYRQVRGAASALIAYRQRYGHLPQQTNELDDALMMAFKRVSLTDPDPSITPQSRNNYRTFYQFAIAYDPSIHGIPVINGKVTVPDSWSAPPNTIVMLSDGADQFAVWAANGDMKPINDPTTNNPLVILQTITPQPNSQTAQ